jgi:hypothetical protein
MGMMQPPPSYGGQSAMQAQPTGQEQASDPKVILAAVFSKILDLMDAVNTQFPGGEDKISQGVQMIGNAFQEKISRMGSPEPPGPPNVA